MKLMKTFVIAVLFMLFPVLCLFAQWEPDVRLTYDDAGSFTSNNQAWCIGVSGDSVHVVWEEKRDGNPEIYYKRSTNGGTFWEVDTRLTNDPFQSKHTSIAVSGSDVHVVWWDKRDENDVKKIVTEGDFFLDKKPLICVRRCRMRFIQFH